MHTKTITIGIVDDHTIFRKGLCRTVNSFENCTVVLEASNGKELQQQLIDNPLPEILLLDLRMKEMDGFETAKWLYKQHPQISIIILSMFAFDLTLTSLLNKGVKSFLQKGIDEKELQRAFYDVIEYGFHFSDSITPRHLAELHHNTKRNGRHSMLNEKEERFLQLASSELTYKEIADILGISERSVDKLRNSLFEKLHVRSRVGMTMMSIKNGIVA
ncbi:MAG TPA: response regulator transcription factor [Flavisolibacter sp.]|nr:response regulator transcription factor [Flavisolibacter sp.]